MLIAFDISELKNGASNLARVWPTVKHLKDSLSPFSFSFQRNKTDILSCEIEHDN